MKNSSGKYDFEWLEPEEPNRNLNRSPVLNLNLAQNQRETLNWDW